MGSGKAAIALLLSRPKGKAGEEDAPESSKDMGSDARAYFDTFVEALRDKDDDGAFAALQDLIACKDD